MKSARGFTLVEILVAMTMFAVVGGTLLLLFEGGLRAARQATEYSYGILLARSKLTEIQNSRNLRPGTIEGSYDNGYRWRVLLEEQAAGQKPESDIGLKPLDLTLTVSWGEAGATNTFDLKSLYLSAPGE